MTTLRVLVVEDSESDYKLLVHELRRHFELAEIARVETEAAMRASLAAKTWDVIISDWSLPNFSASGALAVVKGLDLDIPFIISSGTIGEEHAVAAMRSGAHDYVIKGNLTRLAAAIDREVREGQLHREFLQRRREDGRFFNLSLDLFCIAGFDGYFKRLNPAWAALGWTSDELMAAPWI
nr:response regulator [Deltaproteobacteria bacterium]